LRAARLSEEHAIIVGEGVSELVAGDRVELIPSHGDTTLNLHDVYYIRRGGDIVDTWPILAARRFR
jgi:D-serine deaminase-like pyridoxal phosphate-dependent protein